MIQTQPIRKNYDDYPRSKDVNKKVALVMVTLVAIATAIMSQ